MGKEASRSVRSCLTCSEPTRERKPFCSNHIEQMPYAIKIHAYLAERAKNVKSLGGKFPEKSILIDETIRLLKQLGGLSLAAAARHLQLTEKEMCRLSKIMEHRNIISVFRNKRRYWVMVLV